MWAKKSRYTGQNPALANATLFPVSSIVGSSGASAGCNL